MGSPAPGPGASHHRFLTAPANAHDRYRREHRADTCRRPVRAEGGGACACGCARAGAGWRPGWGRCSSSPGRSGRGRRPAPTGRQASVPTTVAATTGTIRQTVSATGTIEPAVQSTLSFTVSGTVDDVPAAVGDTVTKGAALASVDDDRPAQRRGAGPGGARRRDRAADGRRERRLVHDPGRGGRRAGGGRRGQAGRGEGVAGRRDAALADRGHRRRGHPARR